MFGKVFGKNSKEMYDMTIYWNYDVDMNDLMKDLATLGEVINRPSAQKAGSRIVIVRNWWINEQPYRVAELYVDKVTEKTIRVMQENKKFAGVKFTSTTM